MKLNINSLLKRILKKIFPPGNSETTKAGSPLENKFIIDQSTGLKIRPYESYEKYLAHQSKKLGDVLESVKKYDTDYELIVRERYKSMRQWKGASMLCLAARLGGEVRAFKALGALAVGIDIEPGPMNQHVLHGDFHAIQFPNESFDYAFTNALDHIYDLDGFCNEVKRVLKTSGIFFVELAEGAPGNYEVLDISDLAPILSTLRKQFTLLDDTSLTNEAGVFKWKGHLISLGNPAGEHQ